MTSTAELKSRLAKLDASDRYDLWAQIGTLLNAGTFLEIGVWKGQFSEMLLKRCPNICRYYMIDPWRHLEQWNKPLNLPQNSMEAAYEEAMDRTAFAEHRRYVLRGETTETIDTIPDLSLDCAYVDGDHTLRGISIDLIRTWPKIRKGGILGGDDCTSSIWQHPPEFEPTLIFPFVAYFAEAVGAPLLIFPNNQFAMVKPHDGEQGYELTDLTSSYQYLELRRQIDRPALAEQGADD